MYQRRNLYTLLYIACLASGTAQAQHVEAPRLAGHSIRVEQLNVEHAGSNLVLKMNLNMDSLHLSSNVRFVLTPLVKNGEQYAEMPQIVVNGRKQDISYRRWGYRHFKDNAQSVRRRNNTEQSFAYTAVVPYASWMKNCNVVVAEDLCGCGGDVLSQNLVTVHQLRTPYMPYLRPQAEARKERHEEGRAFIDFPVDEITLYPDYRNNPRELSKIIQTINLVKEDKNTTITGISIHGFASPESPYEHNAWLAENRAQTLKNYVRQQMRFEDHIFTVTSTPEDWDGLRRYVQEHNLKYKDEILELIDNTSLDPDAKEWRIKSRYPQDYRFMLDNWYPALRHSDYVVTYYVRPFSVEEAKEVLKTKPQQLSLEEMFLVAQTYEPGSSEFNEVMETAARLFPDSETANINAACSRMENGNLDGARFYLDKVGNSAQGLHVKGVLAMLEGHVAQARQLLEAARKAGDASAAKNLEILDLE